MSAPVAPPFAWEPLTPRGVAAFAHARLSRLLLVQFIVALLTAAAFAWLLNDGYFPTVKAAIRNLPPTGDIRSGRLNWVGIISPQELAEGKFLAFDVDLSHSGQIHSTRDVQIEFGADTIRVFSLLGYADFWYPADAPFNRTDLEPFWGAWAAEILFLAFAAAALVLLVSWWLLATVYFLPVWLLALYTNRDLNFSASWKLSGAALLPGALLMAVGFLLYDFGFLNLVSFAFVFAAHLVLGWIYLLWSLPFLSRNSATPPRGNPFRGKRKT